MADTNIIDGKAIAARLRNEVRDQVQTLAGEYSITPGLAVILVGEDAASQVYVRNKRKQTIAAGMQAFEHVLPEDTSQQALLDLIDELNNDQRVNGLLVQLPLPKHISSAAVLAAVDPDKDVDGFHVVNTGRLWSDGDAPVPCTPLGCIILLKHALGEDLSGLHALVIGRSNIVGKPAANLLLRENCTVTVAHSHTRDLRELCRSADIVIVAVGRPQTVRGDWLKQGAAVIDVGINRTVDENSGKTRLIGDVVFSEASEVAGAITPVPGGVGPMTIACLLQNTVAAACRQHGIDLARLADDSGARVGTA